MGWKQQQIIQEEELEEDTEAEWLKNVHGVPGLCALVVKAKGHGFNFVKGMYLGCRFTPHSSLDASVRHPIHVSL